MRTNTQLYSILLAFTLVAVVSGACNKQKREAKKLEGNWIIEQSERMIIYSSGDEDIYENNTRAGDLVITADPNPDSVESKAYTFTYYGANNDTLFVKGKLYTDDKNIRIVFKNALGDSTSNSDLIWTVEKSKKNKQIWSAYGVDSTFFYPPNNFDPSNASNWLMWRITLKRDN